MNNEKLTELLEDKNSFEAFRLFALQQVGDLLNLSEILAKFEETFQGIWTDRISFAADHLESDAYALESMQVLREESGNPIEVDEWGYVSVEDMLDLASEHAEALFDDDHCYEIRLDDGLIAIFEGD